MNISCNIIQDLLPLYAEGLVRQDTKNLVNNHICTCNICFNRYYLLKKPVYVPIKTDIGELKRLRNVSYGYFPVCVAAAALLLVPILILLCYTYL